MAQVQIGLSMGASEGVSESQSNALALRVEAALAGDGVALRALLEEVGPRVLGTARRILRHSQDAEDLAQEALIAFVRDLKSLRDPNSVHAFAARLTTRLAIRARRKRDRKPRGERRLEDELGPQMPEKEHPENRVIAREHAERLMALIDAIPEKQAEALLLRSVHGYTLPELARILDVPENTVKSRIRLAKAAINRKLRYRPELLPKSRSS